MELKTRVWSAGKVLLVAGALAATYVIFAAASMRVALKTREVEVPDLANHSANEATALAANLGLALKVDETRRPDAKVASGRVLAQDPAAGSTTRRRRTVHVWLSAGARSATVPLLVGETERTAQLRLAEGGLGVGDIAEIRSPDYAPEIVVAQTPSARAASSHVALLVNRGERGTSYVMPDLIGVSGERAAEVLRGRGFRVAVVGSNPYPGIPAGIVIRQSPQGGFQVAPGEPVSLEVSR